jgi:hypothetical protein
MYTYIYMYIYMNVYKNHHQVDQVLGIYGNNTSGNLYPQPPYRNDVHVNISKYTYIYMYIYTYMHK